MASLLGCALQGRGIPLFRHTPRTSGKQWLVLASHSSGSIITVSRRYFRPLRPYAVPFRLTSQDAAKAFEQHHRSWFSPSSLLNAHSETNIQPVFLPFWVFEAHVAAIVSGQVGPPSPLIMAGCGSECFLSYNQPTRWVAMCTGPALTLQLGGSSSAQP